MIKKVFLVLFICQLVIINSFGQKAQKIAYVDMEYVLENIPDYQQANLQLDIKVKRWQEKISKQKTEINELQNSLDYERALLTNDLIKEREEDIAIRQEELNKTQNLYFGTKGDLYRLRKQLVKPIQDQVYNAIQEIVKKQKYDFVFDKSSDLIMLYSDKRFDISDRIVRSIVREERKVNLKSKKAEKQKAIEGKQNRAKEVNPEIADKLEKREAKRKELQARIAAQKEEREKQREEKKKTIEAARLKKIEERQSARQKIEEEIKSNDQNVKKVQEPKNEGETDEEKKLVKDESEELIEETKDSINSKKTEIQNKYEAQKAERLKQKQERLKAIEEAKQERIRQREEAKRKIEEKRANAIKAVEEKDKTEQ